MGMSYEKESSETLLINEIRTITNNKQLQCKANTIGQQTAKQQRTAKSFIQKI